MEWIVSLILFILLIIAFFLLCKINKKKKELEEEQSNQFLNYYNQHINGIEEKFNQRKDELFREYEDKRKEYQEKLDSISVLIQTKEELLQSEQDKVDKVLSEQKKVIDSKAQIYEESLINIAKNTDKLRREKYEEDFNNWLNQKQIEKEQIEKEQLEILAELEDFRRRRAAINEAIALENSKEEEKLKHQISLSLQDKEDIKYLLSIEEKINNKQLLRKLIWSEYLQKPFNEMLKRLFLGNPPKNVIYCIENIHNHKKYIGKTSAEVSKRWTEHIKTSLEIGAIKSQNIHKALYGHWDEFTFSVIVVSEKEKISADEKYYIKFFESDIYGYNMKSGG